MEKTYKESDSSLLSRQQLKPNLLSNQGQQFWTIQIVGWLGYSVFVFLAIVHPQFEKADFSLSAQLINLFVETVCGFLLSYFQWFIIQKAVRLPLKKTLLLSFFSASILGVIFNIIKLSCYKVVVYHQEWNEAWNLLEFGGWLLFSLTTMYVWTSIFFVMLYNNNLQKEHEKRLVAQTAVKDAQLQMLRYQLNPHFMFNTLNAISTLIYKNENDKANDMLDKLCEFFRYTLDKHALKETTLAKELELLALYLSIEKVRFGERLLVSLDIIPEARSCLVPSMLLQPLVENAIKYAIEPRKEAGLISITARVKEKRLFIYVKDDGTAMNEKNSHGFGIGMSNTRKRLDTMFNGDFTIKMKDNYSTGTCITISIPYNQGS
ncbi:histidine kinase [Colwellia sp. E2M01]|nr:histidine kinase [Colwellia sp. E2M01]